MLSSDVPELLLTNWYSFTGEMPKGNSVERMLDQQHHSFTTFSQLLLYRKESASSQQNPWLPPHDTHLSKYPGLNAAVSIPLLCDDPGCASVSNSLIDPSSVSSVSSGFNLGSDLGENDIVRLGPSPGPPGCMLLKVVSTHLLLQCQGYAPPFQHSEVIPIDET